MNNYKAKIIECLNESCSSTAITKTISNILPLDNDKILETYLIKDEEEYITKVSIVVFKTNKKDL